MSQRKKRKFPRSYLVFFCFFVLVGFLFATISLPRDLRTKLRTCAMFQGL